MAEVKNAFIKSKMNKDLDARLLPKGEYREGVNIQVSKSEGADVGALENVLGNNLLVDFKTLTGKNNLQTIGLYTDEVNNNIYVFLTDYDERTLTDTNEFLLDENGAPTSTPNPNYGKNIYNIQLLNYSPSANNYVYVYNIESRETNLLLTGAFLNFSLNFPITSINLLEGVLFWTDNRNQPRRITVANAVNAIIPGTYYTKEEQISVASYSPFQPIQLYYKFEGFWEDPDNPGTYLPIKANGAKSLTSGSTAPNSATILLDPATYVGIDIGGNGNKNLVGATITAIDPSTGAVVPGIQAGTTLASYLPTTITLSQNTDPAAAAIPDGTIIYFNYNTLSGNSQWLTSMLDVSSKMNPGGSYDVAKPGDTSNRNYNPNYNGDPDFIEDKFVKFSYRFKYEDGTYSIMAPFTQAAFIPKQDGYFMGQGTLTGISSDEEATYRSTVVDFMENKVNNILLQIPLPYRFNPATGEANDPIPANSLFNELKVEEIEILYKESDGLAIQIVDTIPRGIENPSVGYERFGSDTIIQYDYQGVKPYKTLPEAELIRVYDKAPVRAHGQEIISNRLVYSNFQNKHTPPGTLDYNVAVSEKYTTFTVNTQSVPILPPQEKTVVREYPMHTVKQNRNYQVGVVLSDKFGRSSTTILSSAKVQATDSDDNLTLRGDTVYFPYNEVSSTVAADNNINSWVGDSIKVRFNTAVEDNQQNPPNLRTGWPGLYNGDPTSTQYNPLGWYSYKIVVKQTEQEYYNVYLPGLMNFYPNIDKATYTTDAPDPAETISFITLLSDNIDKVPRDLTQVGPEQKQFRSSVNLYGRVAPENDAATPNPTYSYQFNPTPADTNIAIPDTVSTISNQNDFFNNPAADPGGASQTVKYSVIYQTLSDPLMARITVGGNKIGSAVPATPTTTPYATWLSVYETEPVESKIDIYWETSSSGTIDQLNEAINAGMSGIKGFTTDTNMSSAPDTWEFNLYENIIPGGSPNSTFTGTYPTDNTTTPNRKFFPYNTDNAGAKFQITRSNINTTDGFFVTDGSGTDATNKFELIKEGGVGSNPDLYYIRVKPDVYFYYNQDSSSSDSYTFNFAIQNLDAGSDYEKISNIQITEKLFNIRPSITCTNPITVPAGATTVHQFTGVNGTADPSKTQLDLTWSMTQDPVADVAGGIAELEIDNTGLVTVKDGVLNTGITLNVILTDKGTDSTTYRATDAEKAYGQCTSVINGDAGYTTYPLIGADASEPGFYSAKNICINQASESSGYYWAVTSAGTDSNASINPVQASVQPGIDRTPAGTGLTNNIVYNGGVGVSSVNTASSTTGCSSWYWVDTNRSARAVFDSSSSGMGTSQVLSSAITEDKDKDSVTNGGSSATTNGVLPGTTDQPGGTAYIIVDFALWQAGAIPKDQPHVIWPAYLQYRPNNTTPWATAKDIEGNDIKFGGAQANNYSTVTSNVNFRGIANTQFCKDEGVKDKLSSAITESSTAQGTAPFPAKEDCFESWMDGKTAASNTDINSVGRKLFAVGRNQAYRELSGNAPADAPDQFGEYRLILCYLLLNKYENSIF